MKKPVNIIKIAIILLIVIAVLCGAITLALSFSKDQGAGVGGALDGGNPYIDLFKTDECTVLDALVKEKGLTATEENDHYIRIDGLEISGKIVDAYFTKSGDRIIAVNGEFPATEIAQEDSLEEKIGFLQREITWVSAFLGEILDAEIQHFSIFGADGFQIDPDDSESYQAVFDGTAKISITAKDQAGTLWKIESDVNYEGKIYFRYGHYFDAETYKDFVPNNVVS